MCNLTKLREEKKMSGSTHAQQISQTRACPTIVAVNRELLIFRLVGSVKSGFTFATG
jgi:hypothetical protein